MAHRLATNYAKNYYNRTPIVKVIVENVVTCFFGTRCIRPKNLTSANNLLMSRLFQFSQQLCRLARSSIVSFSFFVYAHRLLSTNSNLFYWDRELKQQLRKLARKCSENKLIFDKALVNVKV